VGRRWRRRGGWTTNGERGGRVPNLGKGVKALDPTIREEEGVPPVVEVETDTTLGVGTNTGGGDEDGHQEGRAEEMGEDKWIRRRR